MRAEFCKAKRFRELMSAAGVIAEEATLKFSDVGFSLLEMDPSHVAMVGLTVPSEEFDVYDCGAGAGDPLRVSVNTAELVRLLKRVKDESLVLEYEAGDKYLGLTLRRGGISGVTRVKRLPVLEPFEAEVPEPKIVFKASARVLSEPIRRLVLPDLADVSEHCQVAMRWVSSGDDLVFSASGDMGSCRVVYERAHDHMLELKVEESVKATFALSYLGDIFKGFKDLAEVVNLSLGENMPIRIEPELPQGSLVYHLAAYGRG